MRLIYTKFNSESRTNADEELKEVRTAFIDKWPLFKRWASSNSYRTMYGKFEYGKLSYFTQQSLEDAKQ